jgi:hypothetical protein
MRKMLWFTLIALVTVAKSCNTSECAGNGTSLYPRKLFTNKGISGNSSGISAGGDITFNGAVNSNGNNGPGFYAAGGSTISGINTG